MRNFNNTINYFFQRFYSNLKYSNRIVHSLRIFFERTTKNTNVVSWLGNVYRNSKWSSLNIQNIKPSFRYQATSIFFIYFSILFLMYTLKHNFSTLQFFTFTPAYFWYIVQDWLSYSSLLLLSLFYFIIHKLDIMFSSLLPNLFLSVGDRNLSKQTNDSTSIHEKSYLKPITKTNNIGNKNESPSWLNNDNFLKMMYYLQKTVNTLNLLDYKYIPQTTSQSSNILGFQKLTQCNTNYVSKFFILADTNFKVKTHNNVKISVCEDPFKLSQNQLNFTYSKVFDLNKFMKSNFTLQKIVTSNLSKNINLAKQNRWIWKSSILSDKTLTELNKITHLKKLISNPELNPELTKHNIWSSVKFSNNSILGASLTPNSYTKNSTQTSQFFNYFSNPLNLNKYEDSIMWLTKRFSFTQKMNYNNQYLTEQTSPTLRKKSQLKSPLVGLLFNKFYYNYNALNLNVSFYKTPMLPENSNANTSVNLRILTSGLTINPQELFTSNDSLFVKSLVTNISFKKNNVVFYSYF